MLLRPDAVTALEPDTGKEIWSVPYESTNGLVVMTPVVWNDYLFVGGYANKNMLMKLAADGKSGEMVWKDNPEHAFSPINVQPTLEGDNLYGFDQSGRFYGIKLPDGDRLWDTTEPVGKRPANSATAFIIRQGDRYFLFTENGDLVVADLTPEGYKELSRAHILDADRRRLRPPRRLVLARLRQQTDVRPQRQRMRRGGLGSKLSRMGNRLPLSARPTVCCLPGPCGPNPSCPRSLQTGCPNPMSCPSRSWMPNSRMPYGFTPRP